MTLFLAWAGVITSLPAFIAVFIGAWALWAVGQAALIWTAGLEADDDDPGPGMDKFIAASRWLVVFGALGYPMMRTLVWMAGKGTIFSAAAGWFLLFILILFIVRSSRLRSGLEETPVARLAAPRGKALEAVGEVSGEWVPPEGPRAVVLLFEDASTHAWAAIAASAGAPVAVLTETEAEAEAVRELLYEMGISPVRSAVESVEKHGDRESARKALWRHFRKFTIFPVTDVVLQPVPPGLDGPQMKRFFSEVGLLLVGDFSPVKMKLDLYLATLA